MEEYWEQYKPTATSAAEHQEVVMDAWQRIVTDFDAKIQMGRQLLVENLFNKAW
jgi:hypothetical protein